MKGMKEYLPHLAGVSVSTIFGFSFMFTKNSLDIMTPMQILAYRFAVAALLLSALKALKIVRIELRGKRVGGLIVLAIVQPISYFICETIGVNLTSSSEAGMMIALIPVVVTIFAALFLKERPVLWQFAFIIISVAGVLFIMLAQGASDLKPNYAGLLCLFGAVLSAGAYNILSRKMSVSFKPVEITFVMMWVGALTFNGLAVVQGVINNNLGEYFAPMYNINSWISVFYLGVLSSVGAFFMMNFMLSKLPASQSSVYSNLTTIVSILAGVFIRGEAFFWFQGVGGAAILLGVWGTNYFAGRAAEQKLSATVKAEKY